VAGGLASTYLGGAATAVGASGAVLGLMGAAVAELAIYHGYYPRRWSRPLLGMLLLLSGAEIAVGFFYPIVDQWGHVGGLLAGGLVGMGLSRNARAGRRLRVGFGWVLTCCSLAFFAYSGLSVATTSYTETLRNYPSAEREVGGLTIEVPESWEQVSPTELYDPGIAALLDLRRLPAAGGLDAAISARLEREHQGGALRAGFDRARPAARSHLELPAPWRGGELEVSVEGASGVQHYRLVVFGRLAGSEIWLGAYYHPAALTRFIEPVLSEALASIQPAASAERETTSGGSRLQPR
jgi:hypothetical protein